MSGKYSKARYERNKTSGKCVACGKADERTQTGKTLCAHCDLNKRKATQKREKKLKAESRCVICGKQDKRTINGKIWCFSCALRRSESYRKRREKKKTAENGNSQTVDKK